MTEWAEENVQLLLNERCCSILTKALPFLDGLTSYNADIIHSPKWISNSSRQNMLYMFLIYMSTDLINISKIIGYFKLPIDTICLIGDKILTDNNSDKFATNTMNVHKTQDIYVTNEKEFNFISETSFNFDQIIRVTTIDLWYSHKEIQKQQTVAQKLKYKIESIDTISATAATYAAITKATHI